MQSRRAVELFKEQSSQFCKFGGKMRESGSFTTKQIKNPIIAFQKPITIQGKVSEKRAINVQRMRVGK
jgi:hypothetical protein